MSRLNLLVLSTSLVLVVGLILLVAARERPEGARTSQDHAPSHGGAEARAPVVLDDRRQQMAGIRVERAVRRTIGGAIRGFGKVVFDESRFTDVNLKLDGWIRDLFVSYTGQEVAKGEPLFTLYSQELIGAQLQYLAALRSREQLTPAQAADRDYQEKLIETPRRRLLYWDVPTDQIRAMEGAGEALEAVMFRSPAAGVVIEKTVTKGTHVESGAMLYRVVDTSVVWIEASFNLADGIHVRKGRQATVTLDGQPEKKLTGRIIQISPALSEPSKSFRVRLQVSNLDGQLRPGMFASVEVAGEPSEGLVVPEDAVIDSGRRQTVFVATGNGRFEPRTVSLGHRAENRVIVLSGVREGEQVVTRATFLLDSESRLRAALESYGGTPPTPTSSHPQATIVFSTDPDPARAGENSVRVELLDVEKRPVTDASVDVRFYMAPMPSMNMPAMHAEIRLQHAGRGVYSGIGTLPMSGSWVVTISALRRDGPIAEKQASLVVR